MQTICLLDTGDWIAPATAAVAVPTTVTQCCAACLHTNRCNTFEFGERASSSDKTVGVVAVKGQHSVIEDNYFAFNHLGARSQYTIGSWSK